MKKFLFLIFFSGSIFAAPDEVLLGKNEGYPVCAVGKLSTEPRCLVGTLSHFDEKVPARKVAKAAVPRALKRTEKEPAISYTFRDQPGSIDAFLARNRNTGLLVMQGDTILAERYQYDRTPQTRFQSYSMAKTVVAMLMGVALGEQKIKSVDDKAQDYVTGLKGHPYGDTRLKDLLTMSSGIRFREEGSDGEDVTTLAYRTLYHQGPGGVDTVRPFTTRAVPAGTHFHYASGESEVLGLAVREATGRDLSGYLAEKIWQPMGAEADATWLIDAGGYELGYMGLNATLRDWGRLGLLLANYGALDGKQLIPADWVKAASSVHAPHLEVGVATKYNGYGYQTWIIRKGQPYFALLGFRGQAVMVDPVTKVVVVHTAVHDTEGAQRAEQFALFFAVIDYVKKNSS